MCIDRAEGEVTARREAQPPQHQPDLLHLGTTITAVMAIDDIKVHNDDPEEEEVSCALECVD
ncbi:hypothetical protein E2C01_064157 [Portunus trituberculatus]|uniref:Uncharacterized protein n=1 Tax=Portunus trituberculatus TaxID=210409 RepID=A0A5B7HMZ1_PORTR|nr:hypothetical protein [Portunus trituberculatus]